MRVLVLGGTRFIGRALVGELVGAGHSVLVLHRGVHSAEGLPACVELRPANRADAGTVSDALAAFGADALVDTRAMTRLDAETTLTAVGKRELRLLVLSSMDVYRAYGSLLAGRVTDAVPIDETGPLRVGRYPYRGLAPDRYDYAKLDVEPLFLARGATVCRLAVAYGEHDCQRREKPVLRRVRAGRPRLPVGPGGWLWTRGHVAEVARGVRLALEAPCAAGEVFNLGERTTQLIRVWVELILRAAGWPAELCEVPVAALPEDLEVTGTTGQPLLFDGSKARALLGWEHAEPEETVGRSVRWHLAHPPEGVSEDFAADDRALAQATSPGPDWVGSSTHRARTGGW